MVSVLEEERVCKAPSQKDSSEPVRCGGKAGVLKKGEE